MKRLHVLILLSFFASCSLSAQKATLSGTIEGLPEGRTAVVDQIVGNQLQNVATIEKDGPFKLNLAVEEPSLFLLHLADGQESPCYLMLMPKDKATVNAVYIPQFQAFKVTSCKGSKNIDLFRQFNDIILDATNSTLQALAVGQLEQLLLDNKDVLISAFLVTFFEQDFENHANLYLSIRDALVKTYPANSYVQHLSDRLKGLLLPGMEAPEISMKDPDGNLRNLSDLRGKVVLIDFWASWCGPCRRENPNVVKLYQKYRDQGFEIYSVSLDKEKGAWLKAIKDDHLEWPNHVSDLNGWTSSGGQTYGIMSVPSTVLIDRDGNIIARNLRGSDLDKKLEEIFK